MASSPTTLIPSQIPVVLSSSNNNPMAAQREAYKRYLTAKHFGRFVTAGTPDIAKRRKVQAAQSKKAAVHFCLENNIVYYPSFSPEDVENAWISKDEELACNETLVEEIQLYRDHYNDRTIEQKTDGSVRGIEHLVNAQYRQRQIHQGRAIRQAILDAWQHKRDTVAAVSIKLSIADVKAAKERAAFDVVTAMNVHFSVGRIQEASSCPVSKSVNVPILPNDATSEHTLVVLQTTNDERPMVGFIATGSYRLYSMRRKARFQIHHMP